MVSNGRAEVVRPQQVPIGYSMSLMTFVVFLAVFLLALVDFRRGFLFATATGLGGYLIKAPYFVFSLWQGLMLAVGLAGMLASYRGVKDYESKLIGVNLEGYVRWMAFVLFGLLVVDAFTYRGVPTVRIAMGARLGADWLQAFGATGWLRPLSLTLSYMATVWHATFLGILFAGLALTVLPRYLRPFFVRTGLGGNLFGAVFALPQPFCSCCASMIAPSLVRQGASQDFSLAFVVGSPMLNLTTLILASLLLPAPYAITRILAGVVLTVPVTYGVARLANRWESSLESAPSDPLARWMSRWVGLYCRIFHLDELVRERPLDRPGAFLPTWFYISGRIALLLVPTLLIWTIVAAAIVQTLPAAFGNNLPSVVIAAVVGTLMMISTWSEIPMAQQMIQAGLSGPAATLLVVLPPVSLPCMLLLAGSIGRFRVVALLGLAVAVVGIATGVIFL
ncbi:MAG: permease [Candidatus Tectomicrobia bacterium]|nr:permease [Candidatus Tectomicrobia bacterium]